MKTLDVTSRVDHLLRRKTQSHGQLSDTLAKLKKAHKEVKEASSCKRKCHDSDSNDLHSTWSVGSGSTGTKHISRNVKSKTQLRNYSNPGLIKTTNNVNTKSTSENTISDPLHSSDEQSDSINMSSSNDDGWFTAVVAVYSEQKSSPPKARTTQ